MMKKEDKISKYCRVVFSMYTLLEYIPKTTNNLSILCHLKQTPTESVLYKVKLIIWHHLCLLALVNLGHSSFLLPSPPIFSRILIIIKEKVTFFVVCDEAWVNLSIYVHGASRLVQVRRKEFDILRKACGTPGAESGYVPYHSGRTQVYCS